MKFPLQRNRLSKFTEMARLTKKKEQNLFLKDQKLYMESLLKEENNNMMIYGSEDLKRGWTK